MLTLQAERGLHLGVEDHLASSLTTGESRAARTLPRTLQGKVEAMTKYALRKAIGAVVVLVLAQTYCSFMTPWIALLFLLWVLGGSKLT